LAAAETPLEVKQLLALRNDLPRGEASAVANRQMVFAWDPGTIGPESSRASPRGAAAAAAALGIPFLFSFFRVS